MDHGTDEGVERAVLAALDFFRIWIVVWVGL